jgi:hypothetical protein
LPNWGSAVPKGTPFTHSSQVRHWPAAEAPAISPTSAVTPSSTHFLYGAMPIRYRSRLCCSSDIALSGGLSRWASQMLRPTAPAIRRPNTANMPILVHRVVVKTVVYRTDRYHSQSVQNPANMTKSMARTASTPAVMSRVLARPEGLPTLIRGPVGPPEPRSGIWKAKVRTSKIRSG